MKVLHINQSDVGGGAAIAGYRLHQGLRRIGIDSRLLVPESVRDEAETTVLPAMSPAERAFFGLTFRILPNQTNILRTRRIFAEPVYRAAEVVNLHNLHTGLYFNYLMLPRLAREKPVVWTLHDMWALTGHCSYSLECGRWRDRCGRCPHPEMYPAVQWDNTAIERGLKARVYARSRLAIVTPSRWLAGLARESLLGRCAVRTIPYGIDTEVYRPLEKAAARARFGLPAGKVVILAACADFAEWRKGADLVAGVLGGLPEESKRRVVLFTLGRAAESFAARLGVETVAAGFLAGELEKVAAYNAADVFLSTTRADNFPLVLQESLACGVPMVATDVGGVAEIVRDGVTGLTASVDDAAGLRARLAELVRNENLRAEMGARAREIAVAEYGLESVARSYAEVYGEVLGAFSPPLKPPSPSTRTA